MPCAGNLGLAKGGEESESCRVSPTSSISGLEALGSHMLDGMSSYTTATTTTTALGPADVPGTAAASRQSTATASDLQYTVVPNGQGVRAAVGAGSHHMPHAGSSSALLDQLESSSGAGVAGSAGVPVPTVPGARPLPILAPNATQ